MAGDVILTPCATKDVAAVVFDGDGDDDGDDVKGGRIVSGDGADICAYTVTDHTTDNMIIIPTVKRRDILNANPNKAKILYTTNYKNVADVALQTTSRTSRDYYTAQEWEIMVSCV